MSLSDWIAKIGTNNYWVAANAHFWFAWALVTTFNVSFGVRITLVVVIALLAAWKEFYFDARFETAPKQTSFDNWTDWAGYTGGALLGLAFKHAIG